jgi:NAD-dependent deacetylase
VKVPGSRILVLTGAGISAESGVSTFRDKGGIWSRIDFRDVATPEGFARDPRKVLDFYNMRRAAHSSVVPNAAHLALSRLEREHRGEVLIVTQNVDELHEAAGSRNLIHMHGEVFSTLCNGCGGRRPDREPLALDRACPACGEAGLLRPDVVWFGEMPYHMKAIQAALREAELFVSIGTSGRVWPAAGFVEIAKAAGARCVELNLEPSEGVSLFDEAIHGKASEVVPGFVERILMESAKS